MFLPHGAGEDLVRWGFAAVTGGTAVRHERSAKAYGVRRKTWEGGFLARVSSARPRPSPTQHESDKRPQDTTKIG